MSAHHLTIAKASFAAGLLRPDITKVGRDDLTGFHSLLDAATSAGTPRTIQKCKEWITGNIAPSTARTAALGKYLSSFSKYMQQGPQINQRPKGASTSRRRLHVFYVVHDVLHHTKYHTSSLSASSTFPASIQPFLVELVQSAASERRGRVLYRIHNLLDIWESEKFYSREFINKLQQAVTGTVSSELETDKNESERLKPQKESKGSEFRMPATHGDPETPYYDLPAGNLLPFLEPGSSAPIRPEQVRALRFNTGPVDKPLVNALKDFLKDVESIEQKYNMYDADVGVSEIDELGQITVKDEAGDMSGDTYYGWSRKFCEKLKRRRKEQGNEDNERRSSSRESSRSRSPSRSPVRRTRYSGFDRNRSASRSRSPPRFRVASPISVNKEQGRRQTAPASRTFASGLPPGPPPLLHTLPSNPIPFQAPSLGPNGIPIPPPRPPNWNGPWPPPPPVPFPYPNINRGNNFRPPLHRHHRDIQVPTIMAAATVRSIGSSEKSLRALPRSKRSSTCSPRAAVPALHGVGPFVII